MKIDFTKEEAQAVVQLIARADIKGAEAPAVVQLLSKFQQVINSKPDEPADTQSAE